MPTDAERPAPGPFDAGLLSPVAAGNDDAVSDGAVLAALVRVERALVEAYVAVGSVPDAATVREEADALVVPGVREISLAAVAGGNPVIPLVKDLRTQAGTHARPWVHRGATSQDILDTALMLVARAASEQALSSLDATIDGLGRLALRFRDVPAAARTLTQHAVPTTVGLRAATWLRAVRRARERLAATEFPAQLGGAGGTLASFVEIAGAEKAAELPAAFASVLGLSAPDGVWHVTRWPVTELGDALVQTLDALGAIAADVATLSRTEIGELAEGSGGSSSAMPQKQNPARSVLIRSAAIRAPHLAATLHTASALAVDERPDGAWHAEWPALRELLRLVLGASAHAAELVSGLRVDLDAVARNLAATGGLVVSERLSIVLGPVLGDERVQRIVAEASAGGDLAELVRNALATAEVANAGDPANAGAIGGEPSGAGGIPGPGDVDVLLDPAQYTGLAARMVDAASSEEEGR